MQPIDYSTATFDLIKGKLEGLRLKVMDAWRVHGPGTTREVALKAGMDILTFRPRTTELLQLGLLEMEEGKNGHEGTYKAVPLWMVEQRFNQRCEEARDAQLSFKL